MGDAKTYKTTNGLLDRIGLDNRDTTSKLGRNPIGATMNTEEHARIVAALVAANDKLHFFPKK